MAARKNPTPHLCWRSITILSLFLMLLISLAWYAHRHVFVDYHPSTQVFILHTKR